MSKHKCPECDGKGYREIHRDVPSVEDAFDGPYHSEPERRKCSTCLGKRIERERRLAGLTQGELAGRLGITQASVSQFERGARRPSTAILRKLQEMGFQELTDAEVEYRALMREARGASPKLLRTVTDLLRLAKAGERNGR